MEFPTLIVCVLVTGSQMYHHVPALVLLSACNTHTRGPLNMHATCCVRESTRLARGRGVLPCRRTCLKQGRNNSQGL